MSKLNLVDIATDSIITMIRNKEYDKDGYLPSEGDLAIKLEVSRSTIREAVRTLEVRGFVTRRHGKGVQIADNSIEVMTRSLNDMFLKNDKIMSDLLQIRVVLEPACAGIAANLATKEDLQELNKLIKIMESEDIDDDAYYDADLQFHIVIAKASKNQIYQSIITAYTPILRDLIIASSPSNCRLEKKFHYHKNILEAIKNRDSELASKQMSIHLEATDENSKNTLNKK